MRDGTSMIVKRSKHPLTDEARVIEGLRDTGIPLADLYLALPQGDFLTMVMEDLGPSKRQPTPQ